ncbi:MAG: hypothetical protein V7631_1770 [Massilia sp.]|jgi:hypothetical protein
MFPDTLLQFLTYFRDVFCSAFYTPLHFIEEPLCISFQVFKYLAFYYG